VKASNPAGARATITELSGATPAKIRSSARKHPTRNSEAEPDIKHPPKKGTARIVVQATKRIRLAIEFVDRAASRDERSPPPSVPTRPVTTKITPNEVADAASDSPKVVPWRTMNAATPFKVKVFNTYPTMTHTKNGLWDISRTPTSILELRSVEDVAANPSPRNKRKPSASVTPGIAARRKRERHPYTAAI
jgi:hypothetical protein